MSIHPRMSFIDQDAVELWPFEVNGAAVGGEWVGAFDVSEKTNYDDFSSSLRKQRNTRSIDSVDVPSQKTPWSDLTSRGGLH